jgi:hypothetical protein
MSTPKAVETLIFVLDVGQMAEIYFATSRHLLSTLPTTVSYMLLVDERINPTVSERLMRYS